MTTPAALFELSIIVSVLYLAVLVAIGLALALGHGGRREEPLDDFDAISSSRFTIPVSIVVPLSGDTVPVSATISGLLGLNYPELEVIVVSEGLSRERIEALKAEWDLEAKEFYYRQSLDTALVRKIYRSAKDARLMMVDKSPASNRADALNCGVNLARFRYICSVEPELVFDADALLRAMSAPMRDPAGVVAASSHVETTGDGARAGDLLPRLGSIRSLMHTRLVWRRLRAALGPDRGVTVWRRDAVLQLGGYCAAALDAELDMMVRLQTATSRVAPMTAARDSAAGVAGIGRVVRSSEIVGRITSPSFASIVSRRTRRQAAIFQSLWSCRKLPGATFGYIVLSEIVTPLVEAWIVVAIVAGIAAGRLSWQDLALAVATLSFGHAVVTSAGLLTRGATLGAPAQPALTRLLLASPFEFIVSGSVAAFARGAGFLAFVKGVSVSGPSI